MAAHFFQSVSIPQKNRFDDKTLLHIRKSVVNILDLVFFLQAIDREFSLHVETGEMRDELPNINTPYNKTSCQDLLFLHLHCLDGLHSRSLRQK